MLTKSYKLIFDISVCYTIGAFLLKYFGGISIYVGGFLILLLTALVSILLKQNKNLKILVMILLPIGSLVFLTPSIPELIVFLLIWAYYAFVTITERFVISRGEFVDMLQRFAYLFLLLAFLLLTGVQKFNSSVQVTGPYLAASLVSAIFLLRHLRAVNHMEQIKLYRRQQFMELMIFLVICLLLTLARAPQNLVEGLKLMYQYLLRPILTFFVGIISMLILEIINLVVGLIGFLTNNKEMRNVNFEIGNAADQYLDLIGNVGGHAEWTIPFLYSIGTIVGLVIVFFFFRWLMGERFRQKLPTGILESRESIEYEKDKRTNFRKRSPKDSRAAVRFYYGKYLLWLQNKRVQLRLQDTTEEINDKYNGALIEDDKAKREASLQLKHLYRKSRYQIAEQITSKEAEKAKQLYQTIRTSKISGEE